MPKYMIMLSHDEDSIACVRALETIQRYGSHFLTHAHWGCRSGEHTGWLIGEFANREEAMQIVPPQYRNEVRIVKIEQFSRDDIAGMIAGPGD
jgi:hypothetical protein